jgi:rRNA maturation protein Nop10
LKSVRESGSAHARKPVKFELKDDYLAYRNAHMRVTSVWQDRPKND